jgi:hypothetical protein
VTGVPPPSRSGAPTAPGSRTLRVLRTYRNVLLLATLVMSAAALWTLERISGDVEEMRTRTAPALLEISEARRALAAADAAAVESFAVGDSWLTGFRPGGEYQDQLGIANQSLAQAAEDHPLGEEGGRVLQMVGGLLVSYTDSIGRAGAHFQREETAVLGRLDLWNATRLMHGEDGILNRLETLQDDIEEKARSDRRSAWTVLPWAAPVAAFLALAVSAQIYLSHRFRRRVNVCLAAATGVVLVIMPWVFFQAFDSRRELKEVHEELERVAVSRKDTISRSDARGQRTLAGLLRKKCDGGCGHTLDGFIRKHDGPAPEKPKWDPALSTGTARSINSDIERARLRGLTSGRVLAVAALVSLLVVLGFRPRIDEYRFQPR